MAEAALAKGRTWERCFHGADALLLAAVVRHAKRKGLACLPRHNFVAGLPSLHGNVSRCAPASPSWLRSRQVDWALWQRSNFCEKKLEEVATTAKMPPTSRVCHYSAIPSGRGPATPRDRILRLAEATRRKTQALRVPGTRPFGRTFSGIRRHRSHRLPRRPEHFFPKIRHRKIMRASARNGSQSRWKTLCLGGDPAGTPYPHANFNDFLLSFEARRQASRF